MASLTITQLIQNAAANAGVPLALALAQAQQESSLNPSAYNAKSGATGLFQLEPGTAADLGVTNPLDPAQNAAGGTTYLSQLYAQFGSWGAALAAFDWGPGNVAKAQATYGDDWLSYAPSETQNYVATILSNSGMDTTASVTPSSVANGAVQYVQNIFSDDSGDDSTDAAIAPGGQIDSTSIFLLTGLALGTYLLADFLAD